MKELETKSHNLPKLVLPGFVTLLVALCVSVYLFCESVSEIDKLTASLNQAKEDLATAKLKEESLISAFHLATKELTETNRTLEAARADLRDQTKDAVSADAKAKYRIKVMDDQILSLTKELVAANERTGFTPKFVETAESNETNKGAATATYPEKALSNVIANSRLQELLKNFVRTSDDFTRPKVYRHIKFTSIIQHCGHLPLSNCGKCFFFDMVLDTNGKLTLARGKLTSFQVILNDDVITLSKLEDLDSLSEKRFASASQISCRLNWPTTPLGIIGRKTYYYNSEVYDFTLNTDELVAIRETFELAKLFKTQK